MVYFWKTGRLSTDIKEGNISEKDWKNYFLAWMILAVISQYLYAVAPYENMNALMVEMIVIVGAVIFGLSITFNTHLKSGGKALTYIPYFVALGLPIGIKVIVLSLLLGLGVGIASEALQLADEYASWVSIPVVIIVEFIYFWRVNEHLRYIGAS